MKKTSYTIIISVALVLLSVMVVGAISSGLTFSGKETKTGFVEFNYTVKDKYGSTQEIDNALKEVTVLYKKNIEGCGKEYVEKQTAKYEQITKKLVEKKSELGNGLKTTGPSKEFLFNERLSAWRDEYVWLNRFDSSKSDLEKQECDRVIENYNKSLEIKKLYDEGKLTIDEAYKEIMSLNYKKLT